MLYSNIMDIQSQSQGRICHLTLYPNQQAVSAWMCIVQKRDTWLQDPSWLMQGQLGFAFAALQK